MAKKIAAAAALKPAQGKPPIEPEDGYQGPPATTNDGLVALKLVDADELIPHATVRVAVDERPFQIDHEGKRYQQSRPEPDGSWVYRHLTK